MYNNFTCYYGEYSITGASWSPITLPRGTVTGLGVGKILQFFNVQPTLTTSTDVNITTPQDGNLLMYNTSSSKWINSSSVTVGQLKTSTGTVTINSTTPSSGKVLTATSPTNAIWETMIAPTQSYLKFNKILFINTSSYVSSEYTILGQQDYIIVNVTDAPTNSTINLPTLSNGSYFYVQSTGTQGVLNTVLLFGSNRIYDDYDSWSSVSLPIPSGNTYKLTY